ncbi:hypothetical protein T484DRAFT_1841605, partial [Baffinella frigidus]
MAGAVAARGLRGGAAEKEEKAAAWRLGGVAGLVAAPGRSLSRREEMASTPKAGSQTPSKIKKRDSVMGSDAGSDAKSVAASAGMGSNTGGGLQAESSFSKPESVAGSDVKSVRGSSEKQELEFAAEARTKTAKLESRKDSAKPEAPVTSPGAKSVTSTGRPLRAASTARPRRVVVNLESFDHDVVPLFSPRYCCSLGLALDRMAHGAILCLTLSQTLVQSHLFLEEEFQRRKLKPKRGIDEMASQRSLISNASRDKRTDEEKAADLAKKEAENLKRKQREE